MSPSYVQLGSLSSLRSPRRFTARGCAHHWGCGRERCPHPLPSGTLRSGPRPSLTGRSTSCPLQVQLHPQPVVCPTHPAAASSRTDWEHPQGSREALCCTREAPTATSDASPPRVSRVTCRAPSGRPRTARTVWAGALLPRTTRGALLFTQDVNYLKTTLLFLLPFLPVK